MGRLILVSNRLPVTLRRTQSGSMEVVRSSGGLIAGLGPVHQTQSSLWIGNPGEDLDEQAQETLEGQRFIPVPISPEEEQGYYLGYSNSCLWPLFHYMIDRSEFDRDSFKMYQAVNERFADVIARHAEPDDTIWVHDYQLLLLPAMLRERLPHARIGFFLHIPFPSSEIFGVLPQREQILRGMLGADLIGVHTYDYARHLVSSLKRFLGMVGSEGALEIEGRAVRIAAHPLGIDVDDMQRKAFSPTAEQRLQGLQRDMKGRQIILGVDRLDYTKGLPLKLEAIKELLEQYPTWREQAVLVQVAVPSRESLQTYREQRAEVEQLVGEINGMYGRPGRMPIHYMYRSVPPAELGALYRIADICLVTAVRDGMNLVAKEYVACQEDSAGVLAISEFAGAASELGEAVRLNPYDIEGTAAALNDALEMSDGERYDRMQAMYRRVRANDVHAWARRFWRALERRPSGDLAVPPVYAPETLANEAAPQLKKASRALLVLAYDGTLREFTNAPENAEPDDEVIRALRELTLIENAKVVVVSGRTRDRLEAWLSGLNLGLVAEHGLWQKLEPQDEWEATEEIGDTGWKADVRAIMDEFVDRVPGTSVEDRTASLVWHYRSAEEGLANWQARDLSGYLEEFLANEPLEVIAGAKIVEVRQHGVDKGAAYTRIVEQCGPFDFQMAIGDDRTDEDMFAVMGQSGYSIRVGRGSSRARTSLSSPAAVRAFLRELAASALATE